MKLIKINAPITLNSGVVVAAPSFVAIREAYFDNQTPKDLIIDLQLGIGTYTTQAKAKNGRTPISDIADYSAAMKLEASIANYTTKDAETVAIEAVLAALTPIYTALKLSVITI